MHSDHAWIGEQAFAHGTEPPLVVKYGAHVEALKFARAALYDPRGIGLLVGPEHSGKTTAIQCLAAQLPDSVAVAVVDADGLGPEQLLTEALAGFGYVTELERADELLKLLNMFAVQQTRRGEAPILLVENLDLAMPATLRALNLLATLTAQSRPALRFLLTSRSRHRKLLSDKRLSAIAARLVATFRLGPLSASEAGTYLHKRLEAVGIRVPDDVFPVDVCDALHAVSNGRPGLLNDAALTALSRAARLPVRLADLADLDQLSPAEDGDDAPRDQSTPPRLILSRDTAVVREYTFSERKVLIGRSEFADLLIADGHVSKLHALLVLYSDALVLLDLNSVNGTLVNSVHVSSTVLASDDIISVGHHRIKVVDAPQPVRPRQIEPSVADTSKMKTLADMRRQQRLRAVAAREDTARRS